MVNEVGQPQESRKAEGRGRGADSASTLAINSTAIFGGNS